MKKLITALITCAFIFPSYLLAADQAMPIKKVLISQVVEHPALNATTNGIIDGLEKNGFKRGENLEIRVESAQGNSALAAQIATKFVNQKPDIVVGVGTLSAQSFLKYTNPNSKTRVKLIFSSVTDPLAAQLVQSLDQPGNDVTGVSNSVALGPQLDLFLDLQPKLKRLGIIYNPGEINSVSIVQQLEKICPELGLTLIKLTVTKTSDVAQAAVRIASQCDALFISNDNTALSALPGIFRAAKAVNIPVYVSDTDAVELGALAALGPNQYELGLQTASMIARYLKGAELGTMPVEYPDKTDLFLNATVAKDLGITFPSAIRAEAAKIIGESK